MTSWADLVDLTVVEAWLDAQGIGAGPVEDAHQLTGGTQNVLVQFRRGDTSYVLRRGPAHPRPRTNDTLRREMRVLAALADTDVPHPRLVAACPDESVLGGSVFFVMAAVAGSSPIAQVPAAVAADAHARRRVGISIGSALGRLGEVDPSEHGLSDLGDAEGFLARQVARWAAELESYARFDGWSPADLGPIDDVGTWLDAHRPPTAAPGILHGDSSLANVMIDDRGEVAAILDWEMVTVGDPLLDLGWLVASWPRRGRPDLLDSALGRLDGLATPEEVVAAYAEHSSRDLTHLDWYVVLACFKLAIVLEGSHARAVAGLAETATGDRLHRIAVGLLDRARETMTT